MCFRFRPERRIPSESSPRGRVSPRSLNQLSSELRFLFDVRPSLEVEGSAGSLRAREAVVEPALPMVNTVCVGLTCVVPEGIDIVLSPLGADIVRLDRGGVPSLESDSESVSHRLSL